MLVKVHTMQTSQYYKIMPADDEQSRPSLIFPKHCIVFLIYLTIVCNIIQNYSSTGIIISYGRMLLESGLRTRWLSM